MKIATVPLFLIKEVFGEKTFTQTVICMYNSRFVGLTCNAYLAPFCHQQSVFCWKEGAKVGGGQRILLNCFS